MELSLNDLRDLLCTTLDMPTTEPEPPTPERYVIVRCRDAGVHAGWLVSYSGREATLRESRRIWYWKPANNASFLSGVATEGLHPDSKIGAPINIILTETCEIINCSYTAKESISGMKSHEQ